MSIHLPALLKKQQKAFTNISPKNILLKRIHTIFKFLWAFGETFYKIYKNKIYVFINVILLQWKLQF